MRKLLIANRGEIACRIHRSASAMGLRTVAVYSAADANSPHVKMADEAVCVGAAEVGASYLNQEALLLAMKTSGADAVHPGYGFLSENAQFAKAVIDAGAIWVGPPPSAIQAMGDKAAAKLEMDGAGVPLVPGVTGLKTEADLHHAADQIGYPLLIKAVAGGGGRGIRRVDQSAEFLLELSSARSEAKNAFGDDGVMLEKFLLDARHIEVQVLADQHGNCVHLFERDCSAQRRRQKIIEEAPAPGLSEELRERMGNAAVSAAKRIHYEGAGTVEFLVCGNEFFFLEMNTRLQVEHPVTELITGLDLVSWQLRIASGEVLDIQQQELSINGHAIEARLYAEDPDAGFLPCTGLVHHWLPAAGAGIRIDEGVGDDVGPFYDPMLAKIIAWGSSRDEARLRLEKAIEQSVLLGPTTNRSFLVHLLGHPDFVSGEHHIHWVESLDVSSVSPTIECWGLAALVASPSCGDGWGSRGPAKWSVPLELNGDLKRVQITQFSAIEYRINVDDKAACISLEHRAEYEWCVTVENHKRTFFARADNTHVQVIDGSNGHIWTRPDPNAIAQGKEAEGDLKAPMMGRVVSVLCSTGELVTVGQRIMVIEAMKMEHPVVAGIDGKVTLNVNINDQVSAGQRLGMIEP